jgi:hypothetical protein
VIFRPPSRDRERLPVLTPDVVGRAIDWRDQTGTMRVLPFDRLSVVETRDDHSLCKHSACAGLLLVRTAFLAAEL